MDETTLDNGSPLSQSDTPAELRDVSPATAVADTAAVEPAQTRTGRSRGRPKKARPQSKRPLPPGMKPAGGISPLSESRIAQYLALKATNPELTNKEISEKIGIHLSTLTQLLYRAAAGGYMTFDDPLEQLKYRALPKVVANLIEFLDEKDKVATIETAKGTLFRQFQAEQGVTDSQMTVLGIKIEPADRQEWKGQIVGVGRSVKTIEPEE